MLNVNNIFSFCFRFWRMSDFLNISSLWCKKHEITLLSFQISSFHSEIFNNSLRRQMEQSVELSSLWFLNPQFWLAGEQQLCEIFMLDQLSVMNHEILIMESECVCYFPASKPEKLNWQNISKLWQAIDWGK